MLVVPSKQGCLQGIHLGSLCWPGVAGVIWLDAMPTVSCMAKTKPRGKTPQWKFWVRRAIAVLVLALAVFGAVKLVGLVGGGESTDPTPTPSPSPSISPSNTPNASGPCTPADITIEPTVTSVHGGGPIRLTFAVKTASGACVWQMSSESMVVKIVSGKDRIWSSQECPAAITSQEVIARANKPSEVTVVWNGRRSEPECPDGTAWARIGTFHVMAAAIGGQPTDVQFDLVGPKKTVITKTAKPKPTKSPTAGTTKSPTASPTKKP